MLFIVLECPVMRLAPFVTHKYRAPALLYLLLDKVVNRGDLLCEYFASAYQCVSRTAESEASGC